MITGHSVSRVLVEILFLSTTISGQERRLKMILTGLDKLNEWPILNDLNVCVLLTVSLRNYNSSALQPTELRNLFSLSTQIKQS